VRRAERELVVWYEQLLETVARELGPDNAARALEIVSAASEIRGFEELKLRRAANARRRVASLLPGLAASASLRLGH
jgi:indolepyruvate ferredoxin oxidoreductase